jgi:hypothetical protein
MKIIGVDIDKKWYLSSHVGDCWRTMNVQQFGTHKYCLFARDFYFSIAYIWNIQK